MTASVFRIHPDPEPTDDVHGWRGPAASIAAGITYRQLDYWDRTGLVKPSLRSRHGSGYPALYSLRDVVLLRVVKKLLETGVSLTQIRHAVGALEGREHLSDLTLMSDGSTVEIVTDVSAVKDAMTRGAWFGVTLAGIVAEVEQALEATT